MATGDIRDEWRLSAIERSLSCKAESHEISSLRDKLYSCEHSLSNAEHEISNLRSENYQRAEEIRQLTLLIEELRTDLNNMGGI